MMVRVIKELTEYVVGTIFPPNHFRPELQCDKLICLNLGSLLFLPLAIFKLRKLVKAEKPDIVHTHLFWPTAIARKAVTKNIQLITTIHAFITHSVEYRYWRICFLDKVPYPIRKSIVIVVTKCALEEYFTFFKI